MAQFGIKTASQLKNVPSGNIAATDVQAAINELDVEKASALGADDNYVTDAEKVVIGNTSATNTGDETAARIGAIVNAATNYTTPLDADKIGIWDAANSLFKSVTWANIKATLKTYFDTLYGTAIAVQSLGVKNADFTADVANGQYTKVTTGSAAMNMTLTNGASATIGNRLFVEITQGATARVVTLKAADANVISSGGLMSSGAALPNSGLSTVDIFEFVWNGLKWEVVNALFDVKA